MVPGQGALSLLAEVYLYVNFVVELSIAMSICNAIQELISDPIVELEDREC